MTIALHTRRMTPQRTAASGRGRGVRRVLTAALVGLLVSTVARAADIEITVTNVRNDHGSVRAQLCPKEDFLSPRCQWRASAPAARGPVTVRITDVPPGVYAAQAFHDENDNGVIDRNLIGIPTEGIGFSRDAPFRFGPPTFDDAAIQLGPEGSRIELSLRYFD